VRFGSWKEEKDSQGKECIGNRLPVAIVTEEPKKGGVELNRFSSSVILSYFNTILLHLNPICKYRRKERLRSWRDKRA
jgi:hypothetical protein